MAVPTLTTLAAEIATDAAAIATEIGGGRTTAEIAALSAFLGVLALRNDLSIQVMQGLSVANRLLISPK